MAAAIALTVGLVAAAPAGRSPESPPLVVVEVVIDDEGIMSPTTTTLATVLDIVFLGFDPVEEEAVTKTLEDVATTTTTTTTTPTTTTSPPTTSATTAPKSAGSPTTAPTTTTTGPPTTTAPAHVAEFRGDYEQAFHSKINSLRSSRGLAGLTRDGSLNARARDWAKKMADSGSLSHSSLSSLLPPWSGAGENVGKGGSVDSVFNALVGSGGHLSNMVGDYTHVGIGVWTDVGGVLWTVHVFTR